MSAVAMHALLRARPLRRRDLAGRRQFPARGRARRGVLFGLGAAAPAVGLGRPAWRSAPLHGLLRGQLFRRQRLPFDVLGGGQPAPLPDDSYRLELGGLVAGPLRLPLAELQAGDALVALLDCTGGFYSRQRWSGVRLTRLLERAGPLAAASHVRVISHTGYRWSFELGNARGLLLATSVGGEPLSHGHGAPLRLVAPGRRGFRWVKWVSASSCTTGPIPARRRRPS
jgi:DMSO/TMAO reductase YedYZ molybdopterin-dependent catalytic subunit